MGLPGLNGLPGLKGYSGERGEDCGICPVGNRSVINCTLLDSILQLNLERLVIKAKMVVMVFQALTVTLGFQVLEG